jgi:hypothetical protein
MKPRHAAALALVIWYLMVPPTIPVEPKAPLADWMRIATYNTANDCVREFFKHHRSPNGEHDLIAETPVWARCVSSDDPRLKEK